MMAGLVFVNLDDDPEPEWIVRADRIEGFRETDGGVEVLMASGEHIRGSRSIASLMGALQQASAAPWDGA